MLPRPAAPLRLPPRTMINLRRGPLTRLKMNATALDSLRIAEPKSEKATERTTNLFQRSERLECFSKELLAAEKNWVEEGCEYPTLSY